MTATKTRARSPKAASTPALAPLTVARFEESLVLVERIAAEERSGFLREMQAFKDEHRDVSRRPLNPEEAAEIATTMAAIVAEKPPADYIAALQGSSLYAYDEPTAHEVLIAAGMATAPALVRAIRRFVALIELGAGDFADAYENDTLEDAIAAGARALGDVEMAEARVRTVAAFEHWGRGAGVASGEVLRSLIETVMGALEQAAVRVTASGSPGRSHLSTSSAGPTAGDDETSSTTPGTPTP